MNVKNKLTKGGKKGGAQFPKFSLKHLFPFLKVLISKTHTSSINIEQLNAGVFNVGAKSKTGQIKSSALKQFGLLEGDYAKFTGSDLASNIVMSDGEQQKKNLRLSFGNVKIFNNVFKTFQNSKIEKTKIGQYAVSTLKVHPDLKDEFVKVLIESAEIAELAKIDGAFVLFTNQEDGKELESDDEDDAQEDDNGNSDENDGDENGRYTKTKKQGSVSNINVSIDVNASMDPEKLEKLLKLLKGYGAI
jgi:hypothetical protein